MKPGTHLLNFALIGEDTRDAAIYAFNHGFGHLVHRVQYILALLICIGGMFKNTTAIATRIEGKSNKKGQRSFKIKEGLLDASEGHHEVLVADAM